MSACIVGLACAAGAGACGDDDAGSTPGIADAAGLSSALAAAAAGDVVRVAEARIDGSFVVPAGVSLVGSGPGTILVAPAGEPALSLTGGTPATRVASLAIEVDGSIGIVVRGSGNVAVEDVTITVTKGVGIGAEDVSVLQMVRVKVDGGVTVDNAITLPLEPTAEEAPTYGIAMVRVEMAMLQDVESDGLAVSGVVAVDTSLTWTGGTASGTRGTGVLVYGGTVELRDVTVCDALRGGGLLPSYGVVASGGATLRTSGLDVCSGEGYGILQSEARAEHVDLVVRDMSEAGVWVQSSDAFSLTGAASRIDGNRGAGLFVIDSTNVLVTDATIAATRNSTRILGEVMVNVGDGVQLVDSTSGVTLSGLALRDNERVGLLLDVGAGSTDGVTCESITVSGTGSALGAIAQGTTVDPAWDESIVREGAVLANDASFSGFLEKVGAISPTDLPRPDSLRTDGLSAIGDF